jgi:hypothetical protein
MHQNLKIKAGLRHCISESEPQRGVHQLVAPDENPG